MCCRVLSWTHLPLGESQIHLSSALGSQSLVLLERATDNTGGDGKVAVVAVSKPRISSVFLESSSFKVALPVVIRT